MSEKIKVTSEPEGPNKVAELHVTINGREVKHLRAFSLEADHPSSVPMLAVDTFDQGKAVRTEYPIEEFTLEAVTKVVPDALPRTAQ